MANKNAGQKPAGPAEEPVVPKTTPEEDAIIRGMEKTKMTADDLKPETRQDGVQESPSGIWTYIGPNIKGYIHTGKTFRGTRAQVLGQAERVLEAEPRVQRLIVAGEKLAQARVTVRTPGNALYETFKAIYEDEKKKEAKSV